MREKLDLMIKIERKLIGFIEREDKIDENFNKLSSFLDESQVLIHSLDFKLFLLIVSKIANNYHRNPDFFVKIDKILLNFKEKITDYFSKPEIFDIFKMNKRVLLFLFEQNILNIDEDIVKTMLSKKCVSMQYPQYFAKEIKPFLDKNFLDSYGDNNSKPPKSLIKEINRELPSKFDEKRKIGENDNKVCKMIQTDNLKDFISYVKKTDLLIESKIKPSIYETNPFLLINNNKVTLIEYASFYGSVQIFQYLRSKGADLTPSIWYYAIHSNNEDMIHFIEECHIKQDNDLYEDCLKEATKCHHNDMANYFINSFFQNGWEKSREFFNHNVKYYNFVFLNIDFIAEISLNILFKYDYCPFIIILLKNNGIDINKVIKILN